MTTDRLSVALLVASTRPGRFADALVPWLEKRLAACSWVDLVVVDLAADTGSPIASRLAYADAFVVLVPEYNHSFPGSLKTAIDAHHAEWARKPVAFVSYGASSGGIRAVEQLRQVFPEVRATTTRNAVALVAPWRHVDGGGGFVPPTDVEAALDATLDELHWWTRALAAARLAHPVPV